MTLASPNQINMMSLNKIIALILITMVVRYAEAGEVRVAVAANFAAPIKTIAEVFEKETGTKIQISLGSSGKLFAQIQNGAPFDVFLSADNIKPATLIANGYAVKNSEFTYALGTLVLWSRDTRNTKHVLESSDYRKLAIANPRLAPYGLAAMETLEHLNLTVDTKNKLVQGENIAQTYQFVASGNADLGFVALSQVIQDGKAPPQSWVVPSELHSPIRQDAALLMRGKANQEAIAFLHFLRSKTAAAIIRRYGYGLEKQ